MGKTKTVIIDDSQVVEEKPKSKPKKKVDDLVAKINAELGVTEKPDKKRAKLDSIADDNEGVQAPNAASPRRVSSQLGTSVSEAKPQAFGSEAQARRDASVGEQESGSADRSPKAKPDKQVQQQRSKPRSKKYQEAVKELDKSKNYPLAEAVDMVKKMSYSKFNGSLEAHIVTAQTGIRGFISLPYASGKKLCILAFGKGAEESGADLVGSDQTIEDISKGKIDFDILIATTAWMPKLARVAKNLGPKGLMPNPKNGTITEDLKKAAESFQEGKTEYKTEPKAPLIHLSLGQLSQPTQELAENIKILYTTIGKSRIKKISLSPTMGPAVKVELASI